MHIMDSQRVTKPGNRRRQHTDAFKQALVERSLVPGASVAAIAQDAGINANLLFNWRRLHLQSLAKRMIQADPSLGTDLDAAEFAVQMLQFPFRAVFGDRTLTDQPPVAADALFRPRIDVAQLLRRFQGVG